MYAALDKMGVEGWIGNLFVDEAHGFAVGIRQHWAIESLASFG
jgi:hypothetical protein